MKEYVLNYYKEFKCIAGKCKHTCCAGWEMNIDEQSLIKYKGENSAFSAILNKGINFKKSKFKSDKSGRCAFLNDKGLCEIIIHLGENSLCQVCRDHPRFRSFFSDRIEMGLGFCCEQATRIILSYENKIQPKLIADDKKEEELDFNQRNILAFREKALDIVQDRAVNINDRVENLLKLCKAEVLESDFPKILKTFYKFERLDKEWTKRLNDIKNKPFKTAVDNKFSLICEQFLVNGIYRLLSVAEDTMWVRAITIGNVIAWWVIQNIIIDNQSVDGINFELIVDVVRAYSSEVEYSEKNLDRLFSFAYNFIKI